MQSILDIADSCTNLTDIANYFLRNVLQTFPEIKERLEQFGKILEVPDILKQIGNCSQFLDNIPYLNEIASTLDKSGKSSKILGEISKYSNALSQMKSSGDGMIFAKVLSQQFGIDSNTFTEFENVVQALKNSEQILS